MANRRLFVEEGQTLEDAQRVENLVAPFGRCGDRAQPGEYQGCGEPLINDDYYTCRDFPDCCRP